MLPAPGETPLLHLKALTPGQTSCRGAEIPAPCWDHHSPGAQAQRCQLQNSPVPRAGAELNTLGVKPLLVPSHPSSSQERISIITLPDTDLSFLFPNKPLGSVWARWCDGHKSLKRRRSKSSDLLTLVQEQLWMQTQALLPGSPSKGSFITALLTAELVLNPLELKHKHRLGPDCLTLLKLCSAACDGAGLAWSAVLTSPFLYIKARSPVTGCWERLARLETLVEELP